MYELLYNRLPQAFIDLQTVSAFQAKLTHEVKQQAAAGHDHWRDIFKDCGKLTDHFFRIGYNNV